MLDDDPDAPATEEEKRAAARLREAVGDGETGREEPLRLRPSPRSVEARWLAAHLRYPSSDDSLGEVRARGLARAAREQVALRRGAVPPKTLPVRWRRASRLLTGSAGLLVAAVAFLAISWVVMEHGSPTVPGTARVLVDAQSSARTSTELLMHASIERKESPSRRLDLLIQARLAARRLDSQRSGAKPLSGGAAHLALVAAGGTP